MEKQLLNVYFHRNSKVATLQMHFYVLEDIYYIFLKAVGGLEENSVKGQHATLATLGL